MTKKIYILAFFLILALAFQIYLTKQFYSVQYGVGLGESICNINELFNCDSVALSKYSNLFGVPNAVLGIFLNLALLIGLLGFSLNSGSNQEEEASSWLNFYYSLAVVNMGTSLVLAAISIFLIKKICIFCVVLYALSILTVTLTKVFLPQAQLSFLLFIKEKTFIALLVSIPLLGLFTHMVIKREYSPKNLELEIKATVNQWKESKELLSEELLSKKDGYVNALFVENQGGEHKIIEFADFLCSHCAAAHKSISFFIKTHKNVEFHFYAYPLDANCNPSMNKKYTGPGYTCTLAKAVYCAGKLSNRAKELHDEIFENQRFYAKTAQKENNSGLIKHLSEFLEIPVNEFETCITSSEAQEVIVKSTDLGKKARVSGTPTILFNGKKLSGGVNFMVLKKALESL